MNRQIPGLVSLAAILSLGQGVKAQSTEQPNIVLMFMDDMGFNDVGFRTSTFQTPNIDRFAKESYSFENCYVPSPTSSPSRVGLLTGRHPIKVGFTRHIEASNPDPFRNGEFSISTTDPGMKVNRRFLPLGEVTIAEALKELNYTTAHIGKWHLGEMSYYPQKQGFDTVEGESDLGAPRSFFPPYFERSATRPTQGEYLTDHLTKHACTLISSHDFQSSPLFLYLAHYGVHTPHQAPEADVKRYMSRGMDRDMAIYHSMIESIDRSLGELLATLEQRGQMDNTIFIFLSDQGSYYTNHPLRGGKLTGALYEGGARVPLFIKMPNQKSPQTIEHRVSTLDLFPTLVTAAGGSLAAYPQLDGEQMQPIFNNKLSNKQKRELYFYRSYDDQPASIIYGDMKYIHSRSGKDEMYDLANDPYETQNIIDQKWAKRDRKELHEKLTRFLQLYETRSIQYPNNKR